MPSEYTELVEFIGEKLQAAEKEQHAFRTEVRKSFEGVEKRFEAVDKRFTGIDDRFNRVDRRLDAAEKQTGKRFDGVDGRLTALESKFDALLTSVDGYMKLGETYYQEMLALGTKVDRLERWLRQVADKVGIKLEY